MVSIVIDPDYGVDAPEITTPATPASGRRRFYAKATGWYDKDDAGVETGLAFADHNHGTAGVSTKHSTADVSNPPTDAELDSAFGTPATVGAGWIGSIDDNGAGTNFYLVQSTGSKWIIYTGTEAT